MFLTLAKLFADAGGTREQALLVHPVQLSRFADEYWLSTRLVPELPIGTTASLAPFLGEDAIVAGLGLPTQPPPPLLLAPSGIVTPEPGTWSGDLGPGSSGIGLLWDHLIYAYLIETTGALEIFAEVVRRLVIGETLGKLSIESHQWLRTTEELFFRDPPLFSIAGIVSEARPHARVTRRNAYWRMFGFDLPHALSAYPPSAGERSDWKAHAGLGVNTDFNAVWTELLHQVSIGLENQRNTSGTNATDQSFIALLCESIADMLTNRRRGGMLAREEFMHVSVLSWFHLTLQSDTPIIVDLKAEATSPADRLALVAQRVGMAPAARSRELIDLAQPMSSLLRSIELGLFSDPAAASALSDDTTPVGSEMRDTIDRWSSATGTHIKDRPIATSVPLSAQPLRIPAPTPARPPASLSATASPNGQLVR
jgi:hypothetical protein